MFTININLSSTAIQLGKRGENKVTQIVFDYAEWAETFGSGVVTLLVKRKGDASAYPVTVSCAGNKATWLVSSTDTAYAGRGSAEFL